MVELDETHAALRQPPRQQTVRRERAVPAARAVHVEDALRLVGQVEQSRHAGLHAKRQLVLLNARGDFRVLRDAFSPLIELLHGADDITLTLSIDPPGSANIQYRIALGAKLDALELSGQKAAVPLPRRDRLSLAKPTQRRQHDKTRQTIGFGAKPV